MQVAFIISQSGNRANGGVESITKVIEHLDPALRPLVFTQLETPVNERWRRAGAEVIVHQLPYPVGAPFLQDTASAQLDRVSGIASANARVYALIRERRIPVVHINDSFSLIHALPGVLAAGARIVHNIRGTTPDLGWSSRWRMRLFRNLVDRQLVLSREMKGFWERELGGPDGGAPLDFIYSIVEPERFSPPTAPAREALRRELGLDPEELALGFVAAFTPNKNQLGMIQQAMPLIAERLPQARLYFVGDFRPREEPYAQACQEAVERLGLQERVSFMGFQDRIERWYQALDWVVLTSGEEGMARCMIEGIACGTPMVSFDVCSAREILEDNDCGIVVPQGDYRGLVDALVSRSPAQRKTMAARGAALAAERFTPASVAAAYRALYEELASQPPRSPHLRRTAPGA